MNRILSLVVACASAVALSPSVQAKPDKDKGARGGGGGQSQARASAPSRPQARPGGGSVARVQPNRQSFQVQRFNSPQMTRPQIQGSSPSVALTGRGINGNTTYNQRVQQYRNQQLLAQRRENWQDRRDRWQDRHDNDHRWDVPYDVHRHWDHDRIHEWNNHRYHWYNNAWVVISPGFGYGYDYPYDYGYGYNDYYYDSPGVVYSQRYSGGSVTARVQDELAREGYDPGPVDGVIGPQTRDAIIDYQKDHDLPVTGRIDTPLLRELGL